MLFRLFNRNYQISLEHKTFSRTEFENKSKLFGTKMVPFQITKILAIFINSKQLYCVTWGPYLTTNFHQIYCSFIWQEDYYYADILFRLFVKKIIRLLKYKTSSTTRFANESDFLGTKMVSFSKHKSRKLKLNIICH